MSNHIADAGKMVCPKCHAPVQPSCLNAVVIQFQCGSMVDAGDGTWHDETMQCITRQRDQFRNANAALVEEVERLQDECRIAILRAERAEERVKRLEEAGDAMLNAWCMPEDSMEHSDWVALSSDAKRKWHTAKATP